MRLLVFSSEDTLIMPEQCGTIHHRQAKPNKLSYVTCDRSVAQNGNRIVLKALKLIN